jgi:Fe-S cluster assembly iron-binding protein IscA
MISMTDTAKKELDAYFEGNTPDSIRVFLSGGCSGARLALALDEATHTDSRAEEKGYNFCMDKQLLEQVSHVTIDFSYAGFSVEPKLPLPDMGSKCGACASAGGCSPAK